MQKIFKIGVLLLLTTLCLIEIAPAAYAVVPSEATRFTIVLNQIRGNECCDPGNLAFFQQQQEALNARGLEGNFALRFDALQDETFISQAKKFPEFSYGALLEITPTLAAAAGVEYSGSPERWYEAQSIFLIGYSQSDRQKLLDTVMGAFFDVFDQYPRFTSSWMIDAWSLSYLKAKYGIAVQQITREQFGTDSYTLYGGPVHYPYWPSSKWTLIPEWHNFREPLIIRQTIMDPVMNYGDKSDSFTSQPNDYALRRDTTEYFWHLFTQAHAQPNEYTFALIGLENSMPKFAQDEFLHQLDLVSQWQNEKQAVVRIEDFEQWLKINSTQQLMVYSGHEKNDTREQAWWITTPQYRARVRLSDDQLFISDLRVYDSRFVDPYFNEQAKTHGWWIVPFVLDGSRFFLEEESPLVLKNDSLKNRAREFGEPARIVLAQRADNLKTERSGNGFIFSLDGEPLITFTPTEITYHNELLIFAGPRMPAPIMDLMWQEELIGGWGFETNINEKDTHLTPTINFTNFSEMRQRFSTLLFPQIVDGVLSPENSLVYVNNAFAIAGRNPVRFVFFPQDRTGQAILLGTYPTVMAQPAVTNVSLHEQHGSNGMLFIDLENDLPLKTKVTIEKDGFQETHTVYFAPDCKEQISYCVTHPIEFVWYIRSIIDDRLRIFYESRQKQQLFHVS